jgi:hypothetical protein
MSPKDQNSVTQNTIQIDTAVALDSLSIKIKSQNIKNNQILNNSAKMDSGGIIITVNPVEANDATIMLIQKSRTIVYPSGGRTSRPIDFDTLGIWKAPLSIQMSFGDYNIISHKEGFKDLARSFRFIKNNDSISIEMISFAYLQHKREQFRSYKWISAGFSIVAGIASYYFYNRVKTYEDEYNEAVSSEVIQDKKAQMDRYRKYYKISSGSTFAALGGFAVFWSFELSY